VEILSIGETGRIWQGNSLKFVFAQLDTVQGISGVCNSRSKWERDFIRWELCPGFGKSVVVGY